LEVQGCCFWRSDVMRGGCWWHARVGSSGDSHGKLEGF